ncbi:MAG TPA: GntR family transcriptional regulator [Gryllotalpicola sp.]
MTDAPRASITTLYQQLAADLRRRIVDGEFAVGSTLPAEHRLAEHYGVARETVRNALASLERRGTLVPRQGKGWIVQSTLQTQGFHELRSFAQWAESRGMTPGGRVITQGHGQASVQEARTLDLAPGTDVLRVIRLRTLDGRPVMLERSSYAPWVIPTVESLPAELPSVVRAMEQAGITMVFGRHRIDAVSASSEDARLLGVRRSSGLLRVQRETFAKDGRAIEHGEDRYLPGTVTFEVDSSAGSAAVRRTMS